MFKGGIGWPEVLIILAVLLLLFGAKRLPEMGRSLGKSMREFKSATKGLADDVKSGLDDEEEPEEEVAAPRAKGGAKGSAD
jgi:TatA/E family protein of Tat protein translocase